MMNWLRNIFFNKKKKENNKSEFYKKLQSGGRVSEISKLNENKHDEFDTFQQMQILGSVASWDDNFEKEYMQKPEYTDEDRRIDDAEDKGIYSYPIGISEEREIHQSWIDDSYNTPSDSTSYDSSSSYDDSSTVSGDW